MREFNIKLWRHHEAKDWSVEVDGRLHRHVCTRTLEDLVDYALVAAQEAELDSLAMSTAIPLIEELTGSSSP